MQARCYVVGYRGGVTSRLVAVLESYQPCSSDEATHVERIRRVAAAGQGWSRATPLHATGSALIVHPPTRRVLLRWHDRQQAWLQVGGHGDPGETDPFAIALREATEETGLTDLRAWPAPDDPRLLQVVVVPVPAGKGEPAHEHADLRYLLATSSPETVRAENATAELRWLDLQQALDEVTEDNLRVCLGRAIELL